MAASRKVATGILAPLLLLFSAASNADINSLAWLTGCWSPDGQQAGSIEQWTAPAGKSMLGLNRTVRDGKTVAFEFMHISEDDAGKIVLTALPSGQAKARFALTSVSDNKVVFENPGHDFPQKIMYHLQDRDTLIGRIEGVIDGNDQAVDFPMTKSHCGDDGKQQ